MRRLRFEPRAAAIGRSVRRKAILWTAALLLGATWTAPGPVWAAHPLQGELESMFGALSNFTSPGAFESARRGVIAGGGLSVRNRTYDIQLAAFVPPSFKGGCGGIDIFLGSFSYISLDQFLSFLRAIAAQAAGYAFQMALASSCDLCVKIMESMRKAAQLMNNLNMNSCQLAQGIVTNDFKSIDSMSNSIAAVASGLAGITEDMTGTLAESKTPLGLVESASAPEAKRAIADIAGGNIVWNALTKSAVNDWFGLSADDPSIKEALMSITGTIVVTPADDPDGRGRTISRASYPGGLLTLQDLVEGTARHRWEQRSRRKPNEDLQLRRRQNRVPDAAAKNARRHSGLGARHLRCARQIGRHHRQVRPIPARTDLHGAGAEHSCGASGRHGRHAAQSFARFGADGQGACL